MSVPRALKEESENLKKKISAIQIIKINYLATDVLSASFDVVDNSGRCRQDNKAKLTTWQERSAVPER